MNSRRIIARTLALLAVLAVSLLAAACGDDDDEDGVDDFLDPDIRGAVTTKTDGTGDTLGTLLIEGDIAADTGYDKAYVRVDEETEIFRIEDGETVAATWDDVAEGQTVEAWFEGPVAESYPVQAYAGRLRILE